MDRLSMFKEIEDLFAHPESTLVTDGFDLFMDAMDVPYIRKRGADYWLFRHSFNPAGTVRKIIDMLSKEPSFFTDYPDIRENPDHYIIGALLHDIGKSRISPVSQIDTLGSSKEETRKIKDIVAKHPELGLEYLAGKGLPPPVYEMIAYHHKRIGGRDGKNLPISAHLIKPADFYDMLTNARPCLLAQGIMPKAPSEAKRRIYQSGLGEQLEKRILGAFLNAEI